MTAILREPRQRAIDAIGIPISGALLYIYDVNTTNLKSLYSEYTLSSSLANPLTSDSSGYFDVAYMASGTWKQRCTTAAGVLIPGLTQDYLDTGMTAGAGALGVTQGGTGATTAAAARTSLGAASQTDVDDLSDDVATLSSSLQNIVSVPQGRLTLTSATPVLAADVSASTSVYYTSYIGNQIPIWDGVQFNVSSFSELTLSLVASHTASAIFDVFIWLESGVVTVGTGPAWTTATAGAGARGSGAGTTELERKNGLWTNKNSMTARNGSTTYTVAANKGTYVGSLLMDGTNGQITCHTNTGQTRKHGVWNAYNRVPIELAVQDSTSSWTYNSATVRQSNAAAGNIGAAFCGLPEEIIDVEFIQTVGSTLNNQTNDFSIGIGWNVTNAFSGKKGNHKASTATTGEFRNDCSARYKAAPFLGRADVACCESVSSASGTVAYYGGSTMQMTIRWRG